jgi:hypothetical protein
MCFLFIAAAFAAGFGVGITYFECFGDITKTRHYAEIVKMNKGVDWERWSKKDE